MWLTQTWFAHRTHRHLFVHVTEADFRAAATGTTSVSVQVGTPAPHENYNGWCELYGCRTSNSNGVQCMHVYVYVSTDGAVNNAGEPSADIAFQSQPSALCDLTAGSTLVPEVPPAPTIRSGSNDSMMDEW